MQLEKKWEEFILKKKLKEYYIERVCEVFWNVVGVKTDICCNHIQFEIECCQSQTPIVNGRRPTDYGVNSLSHQFLTFVSVKWIFQVNQVNVFDFQYLH